MHTHADAFRSNSQRNICFFGQCLPLISSSPGFAGTRHTFERRNSSVHVLRIDPGGIVHTISMFKIEVAGEF